MCIRLAIKCRLQSQLVCLSALAHLMMALYAMNRGRFAPVQLRCPYLQVLLFDFIPIEQFIDLSTASSSERRGFYVRRNHTGSPPKISHLQADVYTPRLLHAASAAATCLFRIKQSYNVGWIRCLWLMANLL